MRYARFLGQCVDDVGRDGLTEPFVGDDGHGRWGLSDECVSGKSGDHHLREHGVVFLHLEIQFCGLCEVHGLNDGLVSHIAHLNHGAHLWQVFYDVGTILFGCSTDFQFRQVDRHPDERRSVVTVGHGSRERGFLTSRPQALAHQCEECQDECSLCSHIRAAVVK